MARRKAREFALKALYQSDVSEGAGLDALGGLWAGLLDGEQDEKPAEAKKPVDTPAPKSKAAPKQAPKITEVSRTARTRDDGTQYFEVEYSDGSMEDIDQ